MYFRLHTSLSEKTKHVLRSQVMHDNEYIHKANFW